MSKLDVLYQFDDNYAPFAGVSLTTLFENNQQIDNLTVYLAAKDISETNKELLKLLAQKYNRKMVYLNVDNIYQKLEQLGVYGWNGSLANWMKMFVADLLPESVEQLLYIDSDTLIQGSLSELCDIDLGENALAAVIDSITTKSNARLALGNVPYYNAGVLYFNIKLWKRENTLHHMQEHLKAHVQEYIIPEQDLLNVFFRGKILQLPACYNFQGIHYIYNDDAYFPVMCWTKERYYSRKHIEQGRSDVRIIHFFRFCGEYPWQPGNLHPCKPLFEQARDASLWKDYRFPPKTLKPIYRLEKILYKVLPQKLFLRLHLKVSY